MSLHVLLEQLNTTKILNIVPVGEQHISIGDPATVEGRSNLMGHAGVLQDAICFNMDTNTQTSGEVTDAHACLALMLPWMLGVDSTGTAFFALTEEGLPNHLACDHGTWMSKNENSEIFYEPQENGTTLFLFNGRLFGDNINVTLREICELDIFQTPWSDPDDNSGVLPAQPAAVTVFANILKNQEDNAKSKGYMASAFCFLWDSLHPEHPKVKDISYNIISWLRDKSFQSSPERDNNIIDETVGENLRQTIPQLPRDHNDHAILVHDTATTGHEVMKRAALLAHMTRYIAPKLEHTA